VAEYVKKVVNLVKQLCPLQFGRVVIRLYISKTSNCICNEKLTLDSCCCWWCCIIVVCDVSETTISEIETAVISGWPRWAIDDLFCIEVNNLINNGISSQGTLLMPIVIIIIRLLLQAQLTLCGRSSRNYVYVPSGALNIAHSVTKTRGKLSIFSSTPSAFHISWSKCCLCVCMSVCKGVTNRNRCTRRLCSLACTVSTDLL